MLHAGIAFKAIIKTVDAALGRRQQEDTGSHLPNNAKKLFIH
jgi:hypothetical protein